ncbi:MAG: carbohydrate ABC transporter permease [Acidimicrobiales bacterium]|jgi:multiple sugar transport system permease protein
MRRRAGQLGRIVALGMVVVWSLFPIYWALQTSLSTNVAVQSTPVQWWPSHLRFTAYQALFGAGPESQDAAGGIARSLINITVEATGATVLTLIVSVLGAYAFARLHFRLRGVLFYSVIATLMLPVYATLIPLYRIMADLRLVDTYTGIILVYTSGFIPLAMWIMYNVFMALPRAIEEAAFIDGASTMQAFRKVVLPMARPGIAATAIVTFLFGWSQFIFPLVLSSSSSTQPLTVLLAAIDSRDVPYTIVNAAAIVAVAVPAVIVFFLNRWIVTGITAGSVK